MGEEDRKLQKVEMQEDPANSQHKTSHHPPHQQHQSLSPP